MNSCSVQDFLTIVPRVVILTTLLIASTGKWRHRGAVAQSVAGVLGVEARSAEFLVQVLVTVEVLLASVIAAGYRPVDALWLTLLMLASFTAYLVKSAMGSNPRGCGCFDGSKEPVGIVEVLRNFVLMGLVVVALATGSPDDVCGGAALWKLPASVLLPAIVISGVLLMAYSLLIQTQRVLRQARSALVAKP